MNMQKARELLERTQQGLQHALDNGDEAAADQHMAAMDKIAPLFERQMAQPVGQEAPQETLQIPDTGLGAKNAALRKGLGLGPTELPEDAPVAGVPDWINKAVSESDRITKKIAPKPGHIKVNKLPGEGGPEYWIDPNDPRKDPNLLDWLSGTVEVAEIPQTTSGPPPDVNAGMDEIINTANKMGIGQPQPVVELPDNTPPEAKAEVDRLEANLFKYTGKRSHELDTDQKRQDAIRTLAEQHLLLTQGKKPSLFSWENLLILLFAGPGAVVNKYMRQKSQYHQGASESYQKATSDVMNPIFKAIDQTSLENRQSAALSVKAMQSKAAAAGLEKHPQYMAYRNEMASIDDQIKALNKNLADMRRDQAKPDALRLNKGNDYQKAIAEAPAKIKALEDRKKHLGQLFNAWYQAAQDDTRRSMPHVDALPE